MGIETSPERMAWPEDLFKENDIVAVGERHGAYDDVIISLIEKFSSQLNGVFYEDAVDLQPSVDLYMKTGELSEPLESYFAGAEMEGKDIRGQLRIFDALKERGIRVICIDSSKVRTGEYANESSLGHYFMKGQSRDEDMFTAVMDHYRAHPGKYLIVCGANHIAEGKHVHSGEDTLGTRLTRALPGKARLIDLRTY